jgi:hypothetical protein
VAGALLVLCACAPQPFVEGSLSTLVDTRYGEVRLTSTAGEVAVRFIASHGAADDTVLQVTARLEGVEAAPGAPLLLDLAEATPSGAQRGTLSRSMLDEPPRALPALERGFLRLSAPPTSGTRLTGEFSATFANGTGFAAGHTAFATFEAFVP